MFSLRAKNFRSFSDTGNIEVRPLTFFVGKNGSGKSSISRLFPLLRQSVEVRSSAPLVWYDANFVDFGSIREVLNRYEKKDSLTFEFAIDSSEFSWLANSRNGLVEVSRVALEVNLAEQNEKTVLTSVKIKLDDAEIFIAFDVRQKLSRIEVNGFEFFDESELSRLRFSTNNIIPKFIENTVTVSGYGVGRNAEVSEKASREIFSLLSNRLDTRVTSHNLISIIRKIKFAPGEKFITGLREVSEARETWKKYVKKLDGIKFLDEIARLRSLVLLSTLPRLLVDLEAAFYSKFYSISYIGPSRDTGQRFYRIQELAVNQIDPRGQNFPMFLLSLTQRERVKFSSWMQEVLGYDVQPLRTSGHVSIMLREVGSQNQFNISDMGYGFSQILPVLAQFWLQANRAAARRFANKIVVIEQPELHLHPALQRRIAHALARLVSTSQEHSRRRWSAIIETHSEQLINEVGSLIEAGELHHSQVAIYVFDKETEDECTRVRRAHYDESGNLINWPFGFFYE